MSVKMFDINRMDKIPYPSGIVYLDPNDIVCIIVENDSIIIQTTAGMHNMFSSVSSSMTLQELEDEINRAHNQLLIDQEEGVKDFADKLNKVIREKNRLIPTDTTAKDVN